MQLYAVKHTSPALCRLAMNATMAGLRVCSSTTTSDRRSGRGRSNTTTTSTGSTSASSSHTPDSASSSSIRSSVPLLSWVWLHPCLGWVIRAEWTRHSWLLCVLAGAQGALWMGTTWMQHPVISGHSSRLSISAEQRALYRSPARVLRALCQYRLMQTV